MYLLQSTEPLCFYLTPDIYVGPAFIRINTAITFVLTYQKQLPLKIWEPSYTKCITRICQVFLLYQPYTESYSQLTCTEYNNVVYRLTNIYFLWSTIFVLTNYLQLLLYISYKQSNLYMLVITKAFLVAITRQSEFEHSLVATLHVIYWHLLIIVVLNFTIKQYLLMMISHNYALAIITHL